MKGSEDQNQTTIPFGYTAEGDPNHNELLFCDSMPCPCHEDAERVAQLNGYVEQGLASAGDANRIYRGQII